MSKILFTSSYGNVTDSGITQTLNELGIQPDDVVMIHSRLSAFGKLAHANDSPALIHSIIQAFLSAIPQGTLVVPTFSYSFCKLLPFNPKTTPSDVGALTNEFRQLDNSIRSHHPIFSVAAIGKLADEITHTPINTCFGKDSFFDLLVKKQAKIVGYGTRLVESMTFLHHLEEIARVPYRYHKQFSGTIVGHKQIQTCQYYVRNLDLDTQIRFHTLENYLLSSNLLHRIPLGSGFIETVVTPQLMIYLLTEMSNNPNFLITGEK